MTSNQETEGLHNTYLDALTSIAKNVIDATQKITNLYLNDHIAITPEDITRFYCRWLGFIVNQKIIGDKENLTKLTMDTIKQHTQQGSNLCQIVRLNSAKDPDQIENLIQTNGLIVVPVLKLTQFISTLISQAYKAKPYPYTQKERTKLELQYEDSIYKIFEETYTASLNDIQQQNIPNPLIFLMEHFSVIVGWLMGFFAELSNKQAEDFIKQNNFLH